MRFDSKSSGKNKNTGFYVAIGLCCAAVCLVAASTAINRKAAVKPAPEDSIIVQDEGGWTIDETLDAAQTEYGDDLIIDADSSATQPEDDVTDMSDSAKPTEPTEPSTPDVVEANTLPMPTDDDDVQTLAVISYAAPMDGAVTKGFSGAELVYCSTMGDWRVHSGVDIAGDAGSEVKAAANGIVSDFIEDMLYGYTAIVQQQDGSMMYYCGLTGEQKVSAGLEVKAGDLIGYLGEVPCEAAEGSHLHLALMKDGGFVDPASVMSIG